MTVSDLATPLWPKSSRSTDTGGQCVEVAAVTLTVAGWDATPSVGA